MPRSIHSLPELTVAGPDDVLPIVVSGGTTKRITVDNLGNAVPTKPHTHVAADITDLGSAAAASVSDFDSAGAAAAAQAASQPLDANLSAIAALATAVFGLDSLTQADAASFRSHIGAGTSSFDGAYGSLSGVPSTFAPSAHWHSLADISDAGTAAGYSVTAFDPAGAASTVQSNLATHAGLSTTAHGGIVASSDARLTDARTPTAHTHTLANITDAGTAASHATGDFDAAGAAAAAQAASQPLDSDLTAIAALTTTSFGRSALTQADAGTFRSYIGAGTSSFNGAYASLTGIPSTFAPSAHTHTLSQITDAGTAASHATGDFEVAGAAAAAQAASQPLDSDLTAIAAIATTSFGRGGLTQTDAAGFRSYIGAGTSSFNGAYASLSGIPSTFTPSAHTHTVSQITDFPASLLPSAHHTSHEPGGTDAMAVDALAGVGSLRTVGTGALQACAGNDSRLADTRTPTDSSVTNAKVAAAAAIAESKLALNFATHSNANDPASGEKSALAGTSGTPGAANKYVTDGDSRNTNARTPAAHAASHAAAGSDALTLTEAQVTNLTTDLAAKEATANKGATSGYASLDASTKVPIAQLPVIIHTQPSTLLQNQTIGSGESGVVFGTLTISAGIALTISAGGLLQIGNLILGS